MGAGMLSFIAGDSELARRIRAHPWHETELGPPEGWPESLKTLVSVMLAANQQMYVVWGPGRILLYNDRYIEVLQGHHPNALGRNFLEVWSEIANDLRPLVENAYAGIPTYHHDIRLMLERKGYTEETHFAYSYTPVFNRDGGVEGFFCPCIETTEQVRAEKRVRESEERQAFLLELSDALRSLTDPFAIQHTAMKLLAERLDVMRAGYLDAQPDQDTMIMAAYFDRGTPSTLESVRLSDYGPARAAGFRAGITQVLHDAFAESEPEEHRNAHRAIDVGAWIIAPLIKNGRLTAIVGVVNETPRDWTPMEVDLVRDIAERTWEAAERARAETALSESEARFRAIAEQTEAGVAIADREGRLIWVNDRLAGIVARQPDDTMRLSIQDYTHPDDWGENERLFRRMIEDGVPFVFEKRLGHPDRGTRWNRVSVSPRRDASGRVVGGVAVAIDISDRKQAEETLRESEERMRLAIAATGLGTFDWDLATDRVVVNARFREILGLPAGGEAIASAMMEGVVHPDDRDWVGARIAAAMDPSSSGAYEFEHRAATSHGVRWLLTSGQVHFAGEGDRRRAVRIVGNDLDITERKNAEAVLRESEERRDLALESAQMGTFVWHVQEDRGEPDARMLALFNQPPDGTLTLQEAMASMIHPDDAQRYGDAVAAAARPDGSRKLQEDIRVRRPGGGYRWLSITGHISFDAEDRPLRMAGTALDVTDRKDTEAILRESEERQAYLVQLNDVLRPLTDPEVIKLEAMRLLGERLGASRAQYYTADETGEYLSSAGGYTDGVPAAIGNFRLIEFGKYAYDGFHAGETQVVSDARTDPRISKEVLKSYETVGFMAFVGAPFVHRGRFLGTIAVHQSGPREWTEAERTLIEETAERAGKAVEQARAELALRQSEARFQQFANASSGALWIRDAATMKMEYVSPAIEKIYGIGPDAFMDGVQSWLSHILLEDRDVARQHLERAMGGETVQHEFRIQRSSDGAIRWIRDTDFPLHDEQGHIQRIGGIAEDVTEARQATDRQKLLLAELQHRVRNILANVRSIVHRTAETSDTVEDLSMHLDGRINSLARTQVMLTRNPGAGVDLEDIIRDELLGQNEIDDQITIEGDPVELSPKAAEVVTLAIHELATNAVKYGALKDRAGRVAVVWRKVEREGETWLRLAWVESGVRILASAPRREGFGTELITRRVPYELAGIGTIDQRPGGINATIEFPLRLGHSILEPGSRI